MLHSETLPQKKNPNDKSLNKNKLDAPMELPPLSSPSRLSHCSLCFYIINNSLNCDACYLSSVPTAKVHTGVQGFLFYSLPSSKCPEFPLADNKCPTSI